MDIRSMIQGLEAKGYSLNEIAREADLHASSLSFIKSGERKDLHYTAGKRLEAFYNKIFFQNKPSS